MTIYKLSQYFSCLLLSLSTATTQAIEFNENLKKDQSISFNFHDVRDDVQKQGDRDPYAIHTKNLTAFFDWLSTSKWNPVTLQQILDAKEGKHPLPPNAVLLTFDDGTLSNYTHVFPLLKQYKIHAVFAIVTSWIDGRNSGGKTAYLLSWASYNWIRFRNNERRKKPLNTPLNQLAQSFDVTVHELNELQKYQNLTLYYDINGKLTHFNQNKT
ncbi:poly-beta-1,6-N-acetyl-D-glucosamine biosynthesis protein PgaD [Acinetobacter nectaris]|uniref:poly-beta-1,6-N-acetyl-D-glucosamine biosynthesis protein PgaD n=1 Tax=Acinetobacter nectaris TaxID=1219382 RepID=UPI001F00D1A0|nr:poly-beta-1,6-N-acetyl-D-glucosamine biosynthesis protein PgaD [Acinetobacter nectaris]MCF9045930.1 poly-beta-1,6-N-acetyl-D-glucosamine biosynthesis protein PgaD [Acinetobacter nectaris]